MKDCQKYTFKVRLWDAEQSDQYYEVEASSAREAAKDWASDSDRQDLFEDNDTIDVLVMPPGEGVEAIKFCVEREVEFSYFAFEIG